MDVVCGQATSKRLGIIPAAGLGSRLTNIHFPKELLPVGDPKTSRDEAHHKPVMQYSLEAMRMAGVGRCQIVIAESKLEIARRFGDGSQFGMSLSYVMQLAPKGLAQAIDVTYPWTKDCEVCLTLPDTIVSPSDALAQLFDEHSKHGADLTLGVFPTLMPEQLGPVRIADDGTLIEVLDKPAETDLRNTWGLAIWGSRFGSYIHRLVSEVDPAIPLGRIFHQARQQGMVSRGKYFQDGSFFDLGTPEGIDRFLARDRIKFDLSVRDCWGTRDSLLMGRAEGADQ